jgi:hypothetical protein
MGPKTKIETRLFKKGLKNHLNPPFLYRLGGLKNSTTIKQEPEKLPFWRPLVKSAITHPVVWVLFFFNFTNNNNEDKPR